MVNVTSLNVYFTATLPACIGQLSHLSLYACWWQLIASALNANQFRQLAQLLGSRLATMTSFPERHKAAANNCRSLMHLKFMQTHANRHRIAI